MKRLILLLILTLLILLPISAAGQDHHSYFLVKPGVYYFAGDLEAEHPRVGFLGEIGYGYRFHRNFSIQSEIGYLHSGVSGGNDIHGVPISLSAKGVYPIKDFEFFIGAGLGIYLAQYKGELNHVPVDDRDNVWGGHLFTGADYNIASNISIGIEGKYIFTEKAEYNGQKVNLDGIAALIRLGFRF